MELKFLSNEAKPREKTTARCVRWGRGRGTAPAGRPTAGFQALRWSPGARTRPRPARGRPRRRAGQGGPPRPSHPTPEAGGPQTRPAAAPVAAAPVAAGGCPSSPSFVPRPAPAPPRRPSALQPRLTPSQGGGPSDTRPSCSSRRGGRGGAWGRQGRPGRHAPHGGEVQRAVRGAEGRHRGAGGEEGEAGGGARGAPAAAFGPPGLHRRHHQAVRGGAQRDRRGPPGVRGVQGRGPAAAGELARQAGGREAGVCRGERRGAGGA